MVFTNYHGDIKWMEESVDNVCEIIKGGVGVDGSSVGFATTDKSDIICYPDADTKREWTMEGERVYQFFCRVFTWNAKIHPLDPRSVL